MKCIHCGIDSDYKARQAGGSCRSCGRRFAFEPKRDRGLTDMTFKLAIDAVSDDGRLAWNVDHLYYDVCRRVRRRRLLHRLLRRPFVSLDRPSFELLLGRWVDAHGPLAGRLERRVFAEVSADAVAPRVDALGFEHLVVCNDDAIVDMLLVNGFHAEAKCPVLSFSGYPAHVYEPLIPLLRERPPATVVVLHDADWEGCRLAEAIADRSRLVRRRRAAEGGRRRAASRRCQALPRALPAGRVRVRRHVGRGPAGGGEVAPHVPPRAGGGAAACADGRARPRAPRDEAGSPGEGGLWWGGDAWADGDDDVG